MSKAFTKESDDAPEPVLRRRGVPVPEGTPNYLTADGARELRAELDALRARTDRDADADVRLRELADHLATAQIVEHDGTGRVQFGSRIIAETEDGERVQYRIVGAIEADPKRGYIVLGSPLARALLGARVGDTVTTPRGDLELIAID